MCPTSFLRKLATRTGAPQSPLRGGKREIHPWAAVALCALAATAVYLPTLGYSLVWDDIALVALDRSTPWGAFTHSFWQSKAGLMGPDAYYRPLVNASLITDRLIAGQRAAYSHLVNLLLHAAVVVCFGLLLCRLFSRFWPVLVGGLLFGLHPAFADSVAYVSGRTDVLAGLGLAVALLGTVRWLGRQPWSAAVMVWVGFGVGVLSKETAALFPVVALIWLLVSRDRRRLFPRDWILLAGLLVLLAGYLAARRAVLGSVVAMNAWGSVAANVALASHDFGRSLLLFLFPFWNRIFAWHSPVPAEASAYSLVTLVYLVVPLMLRRTRGSRNARLAWFWGLAFLLPGVGLSSFGPLGRLLYLPGPGLVILLVSVVHRFTQGHRAAARLLTALSLTACVALAPITLRRMQVWKNGYTLFRSITAQAPRNPIGHFNLGMELRVRGDVDGAIAELRKAIALDPGLARAYANLGVLLQAKGDLDSAAVLYRRTLSELPDYVPALVNLGILLYRQGDNAGAASELRRAVELAPDDATAAFNLARVYDRSDRPDSAAYFIGLAHELQPDNPQIRSFYLQMQGGR